MANVGKGFVLSEVRPGVSIAQGVDWLMLRHAGLGSRINAGQKVMTDSLCLLSDTSDRPPLDTVSVQATAQAGGTLSAMVLTVYFSLDGETWASAGETITGQGANLNIDATGVAYVRCQVTTDNGADATWNCTILATRFLA